MKLTMRSTSLLLLLLGYSEERLFHTYGDRWLLCNKIQLKTSIQLQMLAYETNITCHKEVILNV